MEQPEQAPLVRLLTPLTPSPTFSGTPGDTIAIKHPYYLDDFFQNVLMRLHAFDRLGGGLHYGTALIACGLVAGNIWNGYFTVDRDGPQITLIDDEVLLGKSYYFHVPSSTENSSNYAIFPSFEHWTFPHNNLPPTWTSCAVSDRREERNVGLAPPTVSNLTAAVLRRDGSCRVTSAEDYVERAHLCPRSQAAWFNENGMACYNLNQDLQADHNVDDICNTVALRSDIHQAFDDRKFVFVPKESRWVVHFFGLTNNLGRFYHNIPLELDPDISPNLLFARFAWTIFPAVSRFLKAGGVKKLRLRVTKEDGLNEEIQTVKPQESAVMGLTRGRNPSPKKRKNVSETPTTESTGSYTNRALNPKDDSTATTPSFPRSTPSPQAHALWFPDPNPNNTVSSCDKATWIKSRRPSNPDLYCCNYNNVEAAIREGLPGKEELGGGNLCLECLGFEYRDVDNNKNCA